jgi:diketogulonate reductase-like aldo/keto reductase
VFDVGDSPAERAPLKDVLKSLVELGGRVVDSSPMYGAAESVVGDLAGELAITDKLFLATKVWTSGRDAAWRRWSARSSGCAPSGST